MDWNTKRQMVLRNTMKYGRKISLVKGGKVANRDDPLGPTEAATVVPDVWAVFVQPAGNMTLGAIFMLDPGNWRECEQVAIVLPSLEFDFRTFSQVIDTDGKSWKIKQYDELRPSIVPIVSYLGLAR